MWWMAAGCYLQWDGYDVPKPGQDASTGTGAYDALVEKLEARRSRFGGEEIGEMWTAGSRVYWLEYHGWDPTLHSFDTETGLAVNYAVPLSYEGLDVRPGKEAVATVKATRSEVTYHVFAADSPNRELTTLTLDAPPDSQRWWAYALDGTDLYYLTTGNYTTLHKVPAGGEPEPVTTLESAGVEVGELWDFGVEGDTMVFIESGRIWTMDLATNRARGLGNEMAVQGKVEFDTHGVLFTAYNGTLDAPWYYSLADGSLTDLAAAIAEVEPRIDGLSESAHHYSEDITRWGDRFVYGGSAGIFGFDPGREGRDAIVPVLMEPRTGLRVDYRYPVVTENGVLFVTGLESESGSVGADGPVWRVDL